MADQNSLPAKEKTRRGYKEAVHGPFIYAYLYYLQAKDGGKKKNAISTKVIDAFFDSAGLKQFLDKTNMNDTLSAKILSNKREAIKTSITAMAGDKSFFKQQYLEMIRGKLGEVAGPVDEAASEVAADEAETDEEESPIEALKTEQNQAVGSSSTSLPESGKKRKKSTVKEPKAKKK